MSDITERLALLSHGAVYTDENGQSTATDAIAVIEDLRETIKAIDNVLFAELTDAVGTASAIASIRKFVDEALDTFVTEDHKR